MSSAVSNVRKRLTEQEQAVFDSLKQLPLKKLERLVELARLYHEASDDVERQEIGETMMEVLFRCRPVTAQPVGEDLKAGELEKLKKHRVYVGNQIKKLRAKRGFTQEKLAKKAGLLQTHICRLELGQHAPTYRTIAKIAEALGVEPGQIDPCLE